MDMKYNNTLASSLQDFADKIHNDSIVRNSFIDNPTKTAVAHLEENGIEIPEMFHAHAVNRGNPLPEEPRLATIERYVYIYRKDGLFEYKKVPGSAEGDDSILTNPSLGACCCCNCCAVEV